MNSHIQLEAPLACKAMAITCLYECWIEDEGALGVVLCDVISMNCVAYNWVCAQYKTYTSSFSQAASMVKRYVGLGP